MKGTALAPVAHKTTKMALGAAVALLLAVPGSLALAHPGHEHKKGHKHAAQPVLDEDKVEARAREEIDRLIGEKKLDETWRSSKRKGVEKKPIKKRWEWLATFENEAATENKILYVFLRPSGKFVAANFTGK